MERLDPEEHEWQDEEEVLATSVSQLSQRAVWTSHSVSTKHHKGWKVDFNHLVNRAPAHKAVMGCHVNIPLWWIIVWSRRFGARAMLFRLLTNSSTPPKGSDCDDKRRFAASANNLNACLICTTLADYKPSCINPAYIITLQLFQTHDFFPR